MKISTKGRYALRVLVDLAENAGENFVSLKDIAERQGISKKYLEQIIPPLNSAGFLITGRGFQGGYKLSKRPSEYTVGDILRVTEGRLAPVACLDTMSIIVKEAEIAIHFLCGRGLWRLLRSILIG